MNASNIIKDIEQISIDFIKNKDTEQMNNSISTLAFIHRFLDNNNVIDITSSCYLNNNDKCLNLSILREKINDKLDIIDIKLYHKYRLIYTITLSIII